jgi:arginine-tRNA-protein transferase
MKPPSYVPYRLVPGSPPELVVHDEPQACPYLEGRIARLPLRIPARALTRAELDQRLSAGDRRQGIFFYHTDCPRCTACEPIRIDVSKFEPRRTQRRAWERNSKLLRVELGPPRVDEQRVLLYNRHKEQRGLGAGRTAIDLEGYREFLVLTSCDTFELRYFLGEQLVGVALVDRGEDALSAVYCYYEPDHQRLSLGTYSILKQIELCRDWGLRYLYLGLYIADSAHTSYKADFVPHERLLGGEWVTIGGEAPA